jgi:hypothetical protein
VELVPIQHQTYTKDLFQTATKDISNGVVSSTTRERVCLFNQWAEWLGKYIRTVSPSLEELQAPARIKLLAAYGAHVRNRRISPRKHKARAQTVALAFRAISTTMQLEGQFNPLADAQNKYPKAISQLLEGYKRADPPAKPKLAIPIMVPEYIQITYTGKSDKHDAIGDLVIIAFYYLLRVGEYTYHKPSDKRRTQQFRVKDIVLWKKQQRLNLSHSQTDLIHHCTAATLNISNQKNGVRSQTIHQEALNSRSCPIQALIRRVKYITKYTNNPDAILGTY